MVPPHNPTEQQIKELRLRVEQATAELRHLNAERNRLVAIAADLGATPDGTAALAQAMLLLRQAGSVLRKALREFDKITLFRP